MKRVGVTFAFVVAAGLIITGCGDSDDTSADAPASGAGDRSAAQGDGKSTTAAKAGDDGMPRLRCPAKIAKDPGGPDIIGIKLGMSRDEALNVVRCHTEDEAYINMEKRWLPNLRNHATELGAQTFTAQAGDTSECSFRSFNDMQKCGLGNRVWDHIDESIMVASPGMPGGETVVAVWRMQNFKDGQMPSAESIESALVKKYGPYQFKEEQRNRFQRLYWAQDSQGNAYSEGHPLFRTCLGGVQPQAGNVTWRQGCGANISVQFVYSRTNPALLETLRVGMSHQENLWNFAESLQAELDQVEEKRRDEELDRARQNGSDVQL
ncbi:MAG: hypothetical protein WEB93_02895 [Sphingomonadales bacterium]